MLKICDFGWSVSQMDDMRVTFCGTYEYMAPEIIDNVGYDKKVDIWSLGILFYELLHGFSPFRGDNPSIVFKNIKAGVLRFASDISPEAKQLISGILKKEPHLRLTIDEIPNDLGQFSNHAHLAGCWPGWRPRISRGGPLPA